MKMDQIAMYAHNETQADAIKRSFGLEDAEWIEDIAAGAVNVYNGGLSWSEAKLRFCYALGAEFEILTYLTGPHWHLWKPAFQAGRVFMSHIGFHMEPGEELPWFYRQQEPIQVMDTHRHTNPYLVGRGRTYHYEIFAGLDGSADVKFIWRKEQ